MKWSVLLLVFLMAIDLLGCANNPSEGWSMSHTHSEKHATIAVPIFQNLSYERGLERDLSKALVSEIESSTPYKVTGTSKADTMLRGTITNVRLIALSQSVTTGLASETLYKVTIDFEWVDLTTGETITARNGFSASALYTSSRPAQEPIELARFQVVQQLASDLVDAMQANW